MTAIEAALPPETWQLALAAVIIFLGSLLAAAGGIGGGGLYVPILMMVCALDAKVAIPISQAALLGVGVIHFAINFTKMHPEPDAGRLIDYKALLLLEPTLLGGVIVGTMLNRVLPSFVLVSLLVVLLGLGAFRSGLNACKTWKEEKANNARRAAIADETSEGGASAVTELANEEPFTIDRLLLTNVGLVFALFAFTSLFNILRGGKGGAPSPVGITVCSGGYWGLSVGNFVVNLLFAVIYGCSCVKKRKTPVEFADAPDVEMIDPKDNLVDDLSEQGGQTEAGGATTTPQRKGTDSSLTTAFTARGQYSPTWTNGAIAKFIVTGLIVGMFAGMLGIGGGLLLSPVLIELGFHPKQLSAISGTAVLVTSASALLIFAFAGMVDWGIAWPFMIITFVGTIIGKFGVDALVRKYKKDAIIVITVSAFLLLCAICMTIQGVRVIIDSIEKDTLGLGNLCA